MEKQQQTPEEEEACETALFESVYGKDWKPIIAKMRGLATDTSDAGVPQPEENEHTVQTDGKGEGTNISHIGVHQRESNVNTERSDGGMARA